ncbi:pyruvate, phosphate dikinase [Hypericibacter adhaerens]|uniref:Pyruvate, phosphate dikinase n=1 Tax=Hypericibacter adhaerens TaxID=2602016 RepID=A0A5J6MYF2_9PROT|nr:PEP/pyruvate-binding domain-containing protein [Hypericibacter adhaerens]QEX21310.1 pyruvate, phosphate dikinase [Hypericibacter adhaerens]
MSDKNEARLFSIDRDTAAPADTLLPAVGNKAFNLMRLAALGLPVPPGFVLSTDFCREFAAAGHRLAARLPELLAKEIRRVERASGLLFGDKYRPLLVSVRSGAAASMPGMMDTLLNIGLSDRTLPGFVALTGNPRLAWDCYRRLIQSFAETVHGVAAAPFDAAVAEALGRADAAALPELDTLSLRELVRALLEVYADEVGEPFPQDPAEQLEAATEAVFRSWESPRAIEYRRLNGLDGLAGTAVTIQRMVFGNAGGQSGAGVGFTRDPASGEKKLYLDFAANAQGEDVVSGRCGLTRADGLERLMPDLYGELREVTQKLESAFLDVQDFEFTIEEGKLFLLQTRRAKRTPWAALRIAVDLAEEGLVTREAALAQLASVDLDKLARRHVHAGQPPLARGVPASLGAASGPIALSNEAAELFAKEGKPPILVREDTVTADIAGMAVAAGILTARGGRTSHASVVARQLNKVCLVGCEALAVAADGRSCRIGGERLQEGDIVTLDGEGGGVYRAEVAVSEERPLAELAKVAAWRAAKAAHHETLPVTVDEHHRALAPSALLHLDRSA